MTNSTVPSPRLYAGMNLGETDPDTHKAAEELVFGFWVFLMSDAVLFALLFAIYGTMVGSTAGGPSAAQLFHLKPTLIETLLLLTSSFTFGMASLIMKFKPHIGLLQIVLIATLILGLSFLGFEINDFTKLARLGAVPQLSGFLSAFYVLVATHFLHVLSGCIWILVMVIQLSVFGLDETAKTRLLRLGIFWHFLDIVWIFIFSLVYLLGLL
ncbi:MAG: cytochrome c oxidase subunit 3 [Sulfuriferula sp.]